MLLGAKRKQIVTYGQKLLLHHLTTSTSGNLSTFDRQQNLVAISPSGVDYREMTPEDVCVVTLEGIQMDGSKKPSSELPMHTAIYRARHDLDALIHVHSSFASSLSCLGWELPAIHYLVALAGPNVPCAPYATFGTKELAANVLAAMSNRRAVLLANHGLLAAGPDLATAFLVAEEIEFCAELYCRALSLGKPLILSQEEMNLAESKMRQYGRLLSSRQEGPK
ncbi:MAG: L-fuculose-phosphate aldolase [Deltaproteobacteria bacterium]|nr:L-fuculose-phosphate aldolase [Deltaproteobacteria bacterium]MBW2070724.1 L-fuculose-phosphate aldolase [Deltaproteobacteria bacterium]